MTDTPPSSPRPPKTMDRARPSASDPAYWLLARVFDREANLEDDAEVKEGRRRFARKLRKLALHLVAPTSPGTESTTEPRSAVSPAAGTALLIDKARANAPAAPAGMLIDDPNPYAPPGELVAYLQSLENLQDCSEVRWARAMAINALARRFEHTMAQERATKAAKGRMVKSNLAAAALVSTAIIAAALIAFGRYEAAAPARGAFVFKIDRLTGATEMCSLAGCRDLSHTP